MLQIIAAALWITFLCWNWGYLFIFFCRRLTGEKEESFPAGSVVCLTGLSMIAAVASWVSLWMPLGSLLVQILLLVPVLAALCWLPVMRKDLGDQWMNAGKSLHRSGWLLLTVAGLLLLVIGSWIIIHPDTLGYHAQTIRWIQEYPVVPGLVNLNVRYGYQGNWYLLCALFGFPFTGTAALTFLNVAVAGWYVLFAAEEIGRPFRERRFWRATAATSLLFLLLLGVTFFDFGQLRLMVASASPDFAAALWILAAMWVYANPGRCGGPNVSVLLAALLAMVAVTLKVSSLPLLLLPAAILYKLVRQGMFKTVSFVVVTGMLLFIPFFTRNVITSGWAVFPSPVPDLFHPDWKYDRLRTEAEKRYISAYARVGEAVNRGEPDPELVKSFRNWLPLWWKNKSVAEKSMLTLLALSLLLGLIFWRKVLLERSRNHQLLLGIGVAGLLFWWVQAPDPRFAFGFILGTTGLLFYPLVTACLYNPLRFSRVVLGGSLLLALLLAGYTVYRFNRFFNLTNLIRPAGVFVPRFTTVRFNKTEIHIPKGGVSCGGAPLPCSDEKPRFRMRGSRISDGFTGTP